MSIESFPPPRGGRPVEKVRSNIVYQIIPERTEKGAWRPTALGAGRFATVFKAQQRSDGKNIREVAIKVLHTNATHSDQYLFEQEVELLKDLTASSQVHIMNTLDLVQLNPMIMCGCGATYRPHCPKCGKKPLRGHRPEGKEHPSLICEDCDYEISGEDIRIRGQYERLLRPPAKNCPNCQEGSRVSDGSIINFVERPAVVMELLEVRLDQFADYRRRQIDELSRQYGLRARPQKAPSRKLYRLFGQAMERGQGGRGYVPADADEAFQQRALVLDKMLLMVQLAEAVAWLHSDQMEIVHKDLTPDNIMVHFVGEPVGQGNQQVRLATRGRVDGRVKESRPDQTAQTGAYKASTRGLYREVVSELVSHPNFGVKVIDFGLADRRRASRKWYDEEDIRKGGPEKWAYLSPEGYEPVVQSNNLIDPLQIEEMAAAPGGAQTWRFLVPSSLLKSDAQVMPGDVLAFPWDKNHNHDLLITNLERTADGATFAYCEGTPPQELEQRQFKLVHTLGVAHDIYAVGALFYYILTEDHQKVGDLRALVRRLQIRGSDLTPRALRRFDDYRDCRDQIPIPDVAWRDQIMVLILRAMVRGKAPYSFNSSRIDRGPDAAQRLLGETKKLYRALQQEILARPQLRRAEMVAVVAAAACLLIGLSSGVFLGQRSKERVEPAAPAVGPLSRSP